MKKIGVVAIAVCALAGLCSCGINERLPGLDNGRVINSEECVAKPDRIRYNYHYVSDNPDDNVYIGRQYPEIDFSLIESLPVYEEPEYLRDPGRGKYPSIPDSDREQYILSAEKIAQELGVSFERYEYQGENSFLGEKFINYYIGGIPGDSDNGGEFEADADYWGFYVEKDSLGIPFGDCVERDLDKIDNAKLSGYDDREFAEEVKKLNKIQAQALSEDTKAEIEAFWNKISVAAPFLFKESCEYISCGQGEGSGYAMRSDSIWLRYTKEDILSEKGKLLDYNRFVDGYEIYWRDNDQGERESVGAAYFRCGSRLGFVGEYRTVSPEEVADELKLGDGEKLAILYIRCKDGERTLLRPVYTKYRYQEDLLGDIENYIDAIEY